jgi:hypothetical protein
MTVGDEKTVEAFVYDNSHTDTAQWTVENKHNQWYQRYFPNINCLVE